MGVIGDIALWRKAHEIKRSAKVALPDGMEVHIWELDNAEVGVFEKDKPQGGFLRFHTEDKPFGVVKGAYKRRATMMKGASNGTLI